MTRKIHFLILAKDTIYMGILSAKHAKLATLVKIQRI